MEEFNEKLKKNKKQRKWIKDRLKRYKNLFFNPLQYIIGVFSVNI